MLHLLIGSLSEIKGHVVVLSFYIKMMKQKTSQACILKHSIKKSEFSRKSKKQLIRQPLELSFLMQQLYNTECLKCNMLLSKTNTLLLTSSWSFSMIGVFANISNILTIGALSVFSVFSRTSISSYVLSLYAASVLLWISKSTGHLLSLLCN